MEREDQEFNAAFADRLLKFRKKTGQSQQNVASALGISQPTMSSYEQGKTLPNLQKLAALCSQLEVSADFLLGLTDDIIASSEEHREILLKYDNLADTDKRLFLECVEMFLSNKRASDKESSG